MGQRLITAYVIFTSLYNGLCFPHLCVGKDLEVIALYDALNADNLTYYGNMKFKWRGKHPKQRKIRKIFLILKNILKQFFFQTKSIQASTIPS